MRSFYRYAEREKLLPTNLAENLSLPRRWERLPKALTDEEIRRLQDTPPTLPELERAVKQARASKK